jgi:chromosome segregation ATPase
MSKLNVTTQQIYTAIEDLIRSGSSPTVAKVRSTLGDKGNANTILTGIHQWFDERGPYLLAALDNPDAVAQINLKSAMKDATKKSLEAISKINEDYEKKLAEQTEQLNTRQAELEQRENAMLEASNAKDQHIADLQARNAKLEEDAGILQIKLKLESDMVADLESQIRIQAETTQVHAAHAEQQLQQAHAQIEQLTAKASQSQQDIQVLTEHTNQLERALATARSEINAAVKQIEARNEAFHQAKQDHQAQIAQLHDQLAHSKDINKLISANHQSVQTTLNELLRNTKQDVQKASQDSLAAIHLLGKETQNSLSKLNTHTENAFDVISEIHAKIKKLPIEPPKTKPVKQPPAE